MNKKLDILDACCPLIAPLKRNENDQEFKDRWAKVDTLPEPAKDTLSSKETMDAVKSIVDDLRLDYDGALKISQIVRGVFFGEISSQTIADAIKQGLVNVDEAQGQKAAKIIVDRIINAPGKEIKKEEAPTVRLGLISAMQKYPALGEKLITTNPIKLKIFPAQVRPSIKNWIADYHHVAGAGSHGSMERADYLYHSDNTKNLSQVDRQKLAMILKSIDENEPVTIDTDKMQIIFSGQGSLTRPAATLSPNGARGKEEESFHGLTRPDEHRGTLSPNGAKDEAPAKSFPSPQDYFKRNTRQDMNKDVQFSYPQKMSSETLTPRRVFPPENPNKGFQKSAQDESYRPDRIHHLSEDDGNPAGGNDSEPEPKVRGNVVDLRS